MRVERSGLFSARLRHFFADAPPPEKAESMDGAQLSTVAFSRNLRAAGTNLDENIFLDGEMNHFFSGRKSTAAEAGGKTKMGKIDS